MTQKEHAVFSTLTVTLTTICVVGIARWLRDPGEPGPRRACARLRACLALSVFFLSGLTGCSPHLVGMNDAALEYAVDPDPATGKTTDVELATVLTKARLSSAQIAADVEATADGKRVRVVIDADAATTIDALVLWRGGLSILPADTPDAAPIAELGIAAIGTTLRGRALTVTFSPAARDALAAASAAGGALHPGTRVIVARDHTRLATLPLREALASPLVVSFGEDVTAYTRAAHMKALLASPVLPPMRRVAVARLPLERGLAAACAILPFLLSFAWLAFVRRFDRARPEPLWLVVVTFALGGLSTVPAALAEMLCATATPWLDPSVMTLGGQPWALPIAIASFTLVVGVAEEGSKFLGAWSLAAHRREFDEPVDGIIYGCAAALGFAAVENVKYFALGRMSGVVIAVRAFVTVPAHLFFGAIWGYALGRKLVSRRTSVLAFFALAAVAHGTFDALLSTDGMQFASTALVVGLACAFVALLRSSLRYGVLPPRTQDAGDGPLTELLPAGDLGRAYFRVGSRRAFYAWSASLIACAFALTVLGGAYEYLHHRIGVVFVSMATTMLALFGVAAYGASGSIPLDVAVDAQGVTLGGARTPWRAVVSLDVAVSGRQAHVVLHTVDSAVRLGPTTVANAQAIAASIRAAHAVV